MGIHNVICEFMWTTATLLFGQVRTGFFLVRTVCCNTTICMLSCTMLDWSLDYSAVYSSLHLCHWIIAKISYTYMYLYAALPPPSITITSEGSSIAGQSYTLSCSVSVVDGLVVLPLVKWLNSSGSMQQSTVGLSLSLTFSPLMTSDAGTYQCVSVITIEEISVRANNSSDEAITVEGEDF